MGIGKKNETDRFVWEGAIVVTCGFSLSVRLNVVLGLQLKYCVHVGRA